MSQKNYYRGQSDNLINCLADLVLALGGAGTRTVKKTITASHDYIRYAYDYIRSNGLCHQVELVTDRGRIPGICRYSSRYWDKDWFNKNICPYAATIPSKTITLKASFFRPSKTYCHCNYDQMQDNEKREN
ncbi:hypothetical protein ACFL0W_02050 [Nanoarchaeota archaeon]